MFRKLALPLAVLTAAALSASTASASTAQTLQFRSVESKSYMFGISQTPPAPGARMIFDDVLYNRVPQFGKPAGARIGTSEVACTITSTHRAQCTVTAHVPNGEITAVGALDLVRRLSVERFAVVGGVGAYSTARGTAVGKDISPTQSLVTISLAG